MRTNLYAAAAAALLFMAGCQQAGHYEAMQQTAATVSDNVLQAADSGTERQFIRSADMKFRVGNVRDAARRIETIARDAGGFTTYAHIESHEDGKTIVTLSNDSAMEALQYTLTGDITLRIPNTRLNSSLQAIATLADYLDQRTLRAEDVALQIRANRMTRERAGYSTNAIREATAKQGPKLPERTAAETLAYERQKESDDAGIANLNLQDQVNYSTVSLSLYQRQEIRRSVIANPAAMTGYRQYFWLRVSDALKTGWHLLQDLLILLVRLWLFLLTGILLYLLYRKFGKKRLAGARPGR